MSDVIAIKTKPTGPYCESLGFRFPAIFRLTGYSFKAVDDMVPDERYPITEYTLSDEPTTSIAAPVFTLIRQLDPALDDGWLLVQHHHSLEHAYGYIAALIDTEDGGHIAASRLYRTDAGPFTLLHRAPRPGCDNLLIGYYADTPDSPHLDWFCGVKSDGSRVDDEHLFWPDDQDNDDAV